MKAFNWKEWENPLTVEAQRGLERAEIQMLTKMCDITSKDEVPSLRGLSWEFALFQMNSFTLAILPFTTIQRFCIPFLTHSTHYRVVSNHSYYTVNAHSNLAIFFVC